MSKDRIRVRPGVRVRDSIGLGLKVRVCKVRVDHRHERITKKSPPLIGESKLND